MSGKSKTSGRASNRQDLGKGTAQGTAIGNGQTCFPNGHVCSSTRHRLCRLRAGGSDGMRASWPAARQARWTSDGRFRADVVERVVHVSQVSMQRWIVVQCQVDGPCPGWWHEYSCCPRASSPRSVEACNPTLCASKDRLEAWALRQEDTSALDSQPKPQSLRLSTKQ